MEKKSGRVSVNLIKECLPRTKNIRNVCILAHVDHGKTTLTDVLLASNGVISQRLAGSLRYMDAREDEQRRGITMQASGITLLVDIASKKDVSKQSGENSELLNSLCVESERYLINLIDSPGHVDFGGQVASAVSLCDCAVVVVDAVEGICAQTVQVLKQAWDSHLTPSLFINKLDRLARELRLSVGEAARCLRRLVEAANAVWAQVTGTGRCIFEPVAPAASKAKHDKEADIDGLDELDGRHGGLNVVFGSALDGWAFTLGDMARQYAEKHAKDPLSWPSMSQNMLWDPECFWHKRRVVSKKELGEEPEDSFGSYPTCFEALVLGPIWAVYADPNGPVAQKMASALRLLGNSSAAKNNPGVKLQAKTLLSTWLPLAKTLFETLVACTPSPLHQVAFANDDVGGGGNGFSAIITKLLPGAKASAQTVGMCRMLTGQLAIGQECFLRQGGSKKSFKVAVSALYILMGRSDLEPVERVFPGNIFGISLTETPEKVEKNQEDKEHKEDELEKDNENETEKGKKNEIRDDKVTVDALRRHFYKTALLTQIPMNDILATKTSSATTPLLHVAIQPVNLGDWSRLRDALEHLAQCDPAAEFTLHPTTGELLLGAVGELHLEQLLGDLNSPVFSAPPIAFLVSEPMLPWRETIVALDEEGLVPETAFSMFPVLNGQEDTKRQAGQTVSVGEWSIRAEPLFVPTIQDEIKNARNSKDVSLLAEKNGCKLYGSHPHPILQSAFALAVEAGPLIGEPLTNIAFYLCCHTDSSHHDGGNNAGGGFSVLPSLLSDLRDGMHRAMLQWPVRLMPSTYECSVQTEDGTTLGKVYAVLNRRHARILREDYNEVTGLFTVQAHISAIETLKHKPKTDAPLLHTNHSASSWTTDKGDAGNASFAEDLRVKTSGIAILPQLIFVGYELLDVPLFPTRLFSQNSNIDEGEEEDLRAWKYFCQVRRRKGWFIAEPLVTSEGSKEKTLKKD